jgi:hypothetical protein
MSGNKRPLESLELEELEEQIVARREMIKKYIDFVEKVTEKYGDLIKREVYPCSIQIVRQFNLADFQFQTDTGGNFMTGGSLCVHYYEIAGKKTPSCGPVLKIHNISQDKFKVSLFNKDEVWQKKLDDLIVRESEILAEIEETKKQQAYEAQLSDEQRKKKVQFLAEAKNLGLL